MFPARVAGPLRTAKVIAPLDNDEAETVNGAAPNVWSEIAVNCNKGLLLVTWKLAVAVAAR